jgi:hypothetical protein
MTTTRLRLYAFAVALAVVSPAAAQYKPDRVYLQSAAVQARYPDPQVVYDTPGFAAERTDFTTHEEMMRFADRLQQANSNVHVRIVGASQEERPIPLLVLSNSGYADAVDLARLGRPVVMLVGLQHGNEPAGGEAMLALAQSLAQGALKPLLDRISVLIVPRANPDGAFHFTRSPYSTVDINRDHVKVALPETAALHAVVNEYQPHVFVDAHEFSVATRWLEKFGVLQSYDLLLQYATNPNVPAALTKLADDMYLPRIRRDVERAGYTHSWYYTTSYNMQDKRVAMGGTTPDIGRNFAGLQHAISFLVESRGVGIGRQSYARRVHGHLVAIGALLQTTADNAPQVLKTVQESRLDLIRRGRAPRAGDDIAVTLKSVERVHKLTMIDPQSGELRDIEVQWNDALAAQPDLVRRRPYAYVTPPVFHEVARRLALSGVEIRRLTAPATLQVESYQVTDRKSSATYVEGRATSRVTTEVVAKTITFPAGSYVYSMAQPNAQVVAVALEPEAPSSFVTFGIIPVDKRGSPPTIAAPSEVPVYRVVAPAVLPAAVVDMK